MSSLYLRQFISATLIDVKTFSNMQQNNAGGSPYTIQSGTKSGPTKPLRSLPKVAQHFFIGGDSIE